MKRVLVAGATGYLGRFAVQEFKKQGYWVRALARTPEKLETLKEFIDDQFTGEVTDKTSLEGICKDIDIVFSSIGITRQKDNLTFMDVDYQGNKNLLEEALKEGTTKFIFVHGKDLAGVCVEAAGGHQKEIHVGGPDIFTHIDILNLAFEVLGKPSKISKIPLWVSKLFTWILKTFTSVKTYGPVEFFMTVLIADLVAPKYGSNHLKDFFTEHKDD